jgi:hypothetical protein
MKTDVLIKKLLKPEAYPEKVEKVELLTTQMSAVFLTGKHAYKVKLPVNFGFLDFTTLKKRKHFCEEEVRLNREVSPKIYLGVVPITEENDRVRIGGSGAVIEYAVKMKQLPQEKIMNRLVVKGEISEKVIDEIARKVAELHKKAETSEEISSYGSLKVIRTNWDENFEQTKEFISNAIKKRDYDGIKEYVYSFLKENKEFFEKRVKEGRIKRCHGDLHLKNIFVIGKSVYLFDRIEFNLRFACSDAASEIAFLAMDLDFFGRKDLSEKFVKKYIEITGDKEINKLLDFYKCYRAYVRGKVGCFKYREKHADAEDKVKALEEARKYFDLAKNYTKQKHI